MRLLAVPGQSEKDKRKNTKKRKFSSHISATGNPSANVPAVPAVTVATNTPRNETTAAGDNAGMTHTFMRFIAEEVRGELPRPLVSISD